MSKMRIETYEDLEHNCKVYKVTVYAADYTDAKLSAFDYALLDDIDNGPPSKTPIADRLVGLEMIVRRIEEAAERRRLAELAGERKTSKSASPTEVKKGEMGV